VGFVEHQEIEASLVALQNPAGQGVATGLRGGLVEGLTAGSRADPGASLVQLLKSTKKHFSARLWLRWGVVDDSQELADCPRISVGILSEGCQEPVVGLAVEREFLGQGCEGAKDGVVHRQIVHE
jgi:hypothetical protein